MSVVALPEEIQTEAQLATVAISGASGLVGSALASSLSKTPTSIINVTRNSTACPDNSVVWSPGGGIPNPARLEGVDAFVHLAGENIATGRWTASKRASGRLGWLGGIFSRIEVVWEKTREHKDPLSKSSCEHMVTFSSAEHRYTRIHRVSKRPALPRLPDAL